VKSARNLLILLGLVCQGLTWDDYLAPCLYALAWAGCLVAPRRSQRRAEIIEAAAMAAGLAVGYGVGTAVGFSTHFGFGHALAFLQLARLTRQLNRREKLFSLLIALFHLAAACTFLFDYRFVAVLALAVALIPKALAEIEAGSFAVRGEDFPGPRTYAPPRLALKDFAVIIGVTVLFFLIFPRGLLTGGLRLPMVRPGDTSTLLDTVLDPTRGGGENSRRILFQVKGERLGYLRCYTLSHLNGVHWSIGQTLRWRPVEIGEPADTQGLLGRQVRVKNPAFLGRVVPVDGQVISLRSTFFRNPHQTRQGMIETDYMWTGPNNFYEYWIATNPAPGGLRWIENRQLTEHPPQSARLRAWVDQVTAGATNKLDLARRLERHFQRNFTYQLGAPELHRLAPMEDFIFNQKAGHCERFAAALALSLRMKGIPSRVVIGYLPNSRNWVSGWYDIRLRDAHAWTEAWFADHGWVEFDATPAASLPPPSAWSDWLEALDFAWYAHVVNFDAPTQNALLARTAEMFGRAAYWGWRHYAWLALWLLPVAAWLTWRWLRGQRWFSFGLDRRRHPDVLATHYYGRMLRLLAARGIHREPTQTPLEFLNAAPLREEAARQDMAFVTRLFCAAKYGGQAISPRDEQAIEAALARLKEQKATRQISLFFRRRR